MKFPHPYYLKHDIKPLSKLPLFRAEERLGLWFAVLHRRAPLQSVLLQGLQGNPCSCTWITSSHCFGLLLLRSVGLVTFKMKLWRFTKGWEALVGWTVLSLQQEGAWVSLWDGGREVSGDSSVFLLTVAFWLWLFVGFVCLWGFWLFFWFFFFYLLLLSNIPSLPFYLVRTIFWNAPKGVTDWRSSQHHLHSAHSLKSIYLLFAPRGKKQSLGNYMVINIKKRNYIKMKNLVKKEL